MNPNSTHQLWSRWRATVTVPFTSHHLSPAFFDQLQQEVGRVYRGLFGSASQVQALQYARRGDSGGWVPVRQDRTGVVLGWRPTETRLVITCRTESIAANDPVCRAHIKARLAAFYRNSTTQAAHLHLDVEVEAGEAGDGQPARQLIMIPSIRALWRRWCAGGRT
jgi:hypothetical protein